MAKPEPVILWSPESEADLIDIWTFGATATSPQAANQHLRKIHAACVRLTEWPNAGRGRPEIARQLRSITVPPHVVFYRATKTSIEIVRVLHGGRDLDAVFGEDDRS